MNIVHTTYDFSYNHATILDEEGAILRTYGYKAYPYGTNIDGIAVDSSNNIFVAGRWADKILKMDDTYTPLAEVDATTPMQIAIAPDGSIWDFEYIDGTGTFVKRNADTLAVEDSFIPTGGDYIGMVFDTDGYLYTVDWTNGVIEKWDVSLKTRVAFRDLTGVLVDNAIYSSLAVIGTTVVLAQWASRNTGDYFTCTTSLTENFTAHDLAEFPTSNDWVESISALGQTHFVVCGKSDGANRTVMYTSDFTLVWNTVVTAATLNLSVGAYPFEVAVTYDYPLMPVLFPAQHEGTPLRKKCVNFEESMSDICLTLNHNVKVTREYLHLTYGGTDYDESSNLRDVLPSQQLIKLLGKDPDYKAIINNFIKNISDMFILINENNTLVKQWLDDYEPDEEGHEFTDVKMKPIIVGKDLSKAMDDLFEGIEDNVTILNTNLEVLKERF